MTAKRSLRLAVVALACGSLFACKDAILQIIEIAVIEVSGGGSPVIVGATVQLTATPKDERGNRLSNRSITWSSSNVTVAQVDANGAVRGLVGGQASITASAEGKSGSANVDVHNPVPVVSSTNPAVATVGGAAFQLVVTGSGFVPGATVRWNGSDRQTTHISSTELRAAITAADVANAGTAQVTVVNPPPGGGPSAGRNIAVEFPLPVLQSINPTNVTMQGAAFTLTVTGSSFVQGSVIRWNGANRTTTFVNSTTLQASISAADVASPGYANVTVFTPSPGGGTSGAQTFAVRIIAAGPFVAAALDYSCAVESAGLAYCWGENGNGQLGDGTTTDRTTPVRVSTNIALAAISGRWFTTCALDIVGLAYCWGFGGNGQMGDGTTEGKSTPTAVSGGRSYTTIAVGGYHICALDVSGTAYCWGWNSSGELGDGTTSSRSTPTRVPGGLVFRSIAAGSRHTCGVTTAGEAWCWGSNADGQLGDGTTGNSSVPRRVSTGVSFAAIAAGGVFTCGRTTTNNVYCWGANFWGQLGNGSFTASLTPVLVSGALLTTMQAGAHTFCGVSTGGNVVCWGRNFYGQVGNGLTDNRNSPATVGGLPTARDVSAGENHSCALTLTTREVFCWGSKGRGQLGDGTTAYRTSPQQVPAGSAPFVSIGAGTELTCGARTSGRAACWGLGSSGQIGNGGLANSTSPADVGGITNFTRTTAGGSHACGLTTTGAAYCWGNGSSGQLGTGTVADATLPTLVAGGHTFSQITAGAFHTCGLTNAGQIFCWGSNGQGQLGNGTNTGTETPSGVVAPGLTFNSVSASYFHTCATLTTGGVRCWGWNGNGQLGDGTTVDRNSPVAVSSLSGMVQAASGWWHSCARSSTGSVSCWGFNGSGELGTGSSNSNLMNPPSPVVGGNSFTILFAGRQTNCGVVSGGVAMCWGLNNEGQLGIGTGVFSSHQPTPMTGGLQFATFSNGSRHVCGVTTGGTAYCWGFQRVGELGIGISGIELAPKRITGTTFGPPLIASSARVRRPGAAAMLGRPLPYGPMPMPPAQGLEAVSRCEADGRCIAAPVPIGPDGRPASPIRRD